MSLGRLLLVLSSSARRYEWRLTFDHFIIPDWSKTSVSCQYWFTSNRFMTAIKAQLGSSLTILVSTCSCLCWYWFGEITSADVVSEFSQILQGLFFFCFFSLIGQFDVLVVYILWALLSVTCQFPHCLFRCSLQRLHGEGGGGIGQ